MPADDSAVLVEDLVRTYPGGLRAVDGIDLAGRARRDLRLPRTERRRQVHDRPHARHAAAPDRRARAGRRLRRRRGRRRGAAHDRRRAAGGGARSADDRPRAAAACRARCTGCARREARDRARGAARARRPRRRRRPARRHLLRRHAPPPRPRDGARPPPARAVPRRADDRPGPASRAALWREVRAAQRRRARRSSSPRSTSRRPSSSPTASASSTRGQHRRRGHARRAEGATSASRTCTSSSIDADARTPRGDRRAFGARAPLPARRRRGVALRTPEGARAIAPVIRALDEAGIEVDAVEVEEPTLDDVFLAVTGHTSEAEAEARPRRREHRGEHRPRSGDARPAWSARSPDARCASSSAAPSSCIAARSCFRSSLLAVIASGTHRAPSCRGFPRRSRLPGVRRRRHADAGRAARRDHARASRSPCDIEGGFFDRLLRRADPPRRAIVLGRVAGRRRARPPARRVSSSPSRCSSARATAAGFPGSLLAIVLRRSRRAGSAALGGTIALRTGSLSLLQSIFPLVFVVLFTAPGVLPARPAERHDAVDLAQYNPLTYIVEAIRAALDRSTRRSATR